MYIIELSEIVTSCQRAVKHSLISQMEMFLCKQNGEGVLLWYSMVIIRLLGRVLQSSLRSNFAL